MQETIRYFGELAKVGCDEQCHKAWGINNRPKRQLSADEDDYEFLADHELGEAPINPGTYEGGEGKPINKEGIPNKWCIRECERCAMSKVGQHPMELELPDYTQPRKNIKS